MTKTVNHKNQSNYRYDIAILRLLAITIVVFFHTYGMMYAKHFPDCIASIYSNIYADFNHNYLINIAMPLFVTISGYLFGKQLVLEKYSGLKHLTTNKFMRLMLPFFVFTVIFMVTTNSVSWKPFYQWTYSHLWFLPMLFWCFIICYLLKHVLLAKKSWIPVTLLICCFILSLFGKLFSPFLGLHGVSVWLYWFVLGILMLRYDDCIIGLFKSHKSLLVGLLVIYIVCSVCVHTEYGILTWYGQIGSTTAVIGLMVICRLIPWQNYWFTTTLISLSSLSFGIYIFHYWAAPFIISSTAQRLFPLIQLAKEHTYLFPFVFSLVTFVISLTLTWCFLKTRIGRFLIG